MAEAADNDADKAPAEEGKEVEATNAEGNSKAVDERNFNDKLGWREALGFEHPLKGWQNLWIRFATDQDVKRDETKGENSRYYKFAQRAQ